MKTRIQILTATLAVLLASAMVFAQSQPSGHAGQTGKQTKLTGIISDSMCGAKHMMKGKSAAECTRACVKQGSDYALVVGKKVYTLKGHASDLDKYAGERVTVKGTVSGNSVTVEWIGAAKGAKTS